MKVLVTGAAGFIGFHTVQRLLERGDEVVGIDNLNPYYDPNLKQARLIEIESNAKSGGAWTFIRSDIAQQSSVETVFIKHKFDRVIHLAAQAGVRYSLERPDTYIESNIVGMANLLEACRHCHMPHLTYASTSSVYGANSKLPFSEHDNANHPLQLYAATKRANELMAHSYSHLFKLPTTGLRFFTVYGPWGRPDMALFSFTRAILRGEPIKVFNNGNHTRDFTYVDDIVEGVIRSSDQIAQPDPAWQSAMPDPATSDAPYRIFNIGNSKSVRLLDYIDAIEQVTGRKAIKEMLPLQPGDVLDTLSDTSLLEKATGYRPSTDVLTGVSRFVEWYQTYYSAAAQGATFHHQ